LDSSKAISWVCYKYWGGVWGILSTKRWEKSWAIWKRDTYS